MTAGGPPPAKTGGRSRMTGSTTISSVASLRMSSRASSDKGAADTDENVIASKASATKTGIL